MVIHRFPNLKVIWIPFASTNAIGLVRLAFVRERTPTDWQLFGNECNKRLSLHAASGLRKKVVLFIKCWALAGKCGRKWTFVCKKNDHLLQISPPKCVWKSNKTAKTVALQQLRKQFLVCVCQERHALWPAVLLFKMGTGLTLDDVSGLIIASSAAAFDWHVATCRPFFFLIRFVCRLESAVFHFLAHFSSNVVVVVVESDVENQRDKRTGDIWPSGAPLTRFLTN